MLNYDDLFVTYVTLQRLGVCKDAAWCPGTRAEKIDERTGCYSAIRNGTRRTRWTTRTAHARATVNGSHEWSSELPSRIEEVTDGQ
jgi:hypothetical protein